MGKPLGRIISAVLLIALLLALLLLARRAGDTGQMPRPIDGGFAPHSLPLWMTM